jgi:hypothetical protein
MYGSSGTTAAATTADLQHDIQAIFSLPKVVNEAVQAAVGTSSLQAPLAKRRKPKVFLSHAWAKDELGRDNHERVKEMNRLLKMQGMETWFDEQGDSMI